VVPTTKPFNAIVVIIAVVRTASQLNWKNIYSHPSKVIVIVIVLGVGGQGKINMFSLITTKLLM